MAGGSSDYVEGFDRGLARGKAHGVASAYDLGWEHGEAAASAAWDELRREYSDYRKATLVGGVCVCLGLVMVELFIR